jgi:DNA-binding GntR family transcriptional regulator
MFEISPTASLRERIADSLRASVVAGELDLGVIYSVPMLAEKFGVSITPVREAMLDLAKEGLVEPVKNKGFKLREPSDKELDDITSIRLLLEPPAIASLTGTLTEVQLAELRRLADAVLTSAQAGDVVEYVNQDRQLHRAMLEMVGNHSLTDIVLRLRAQSRLLGLTAPANRGLLDASAHEHHALIDALAGNDSALVEKIMRDHLAHVRNEWAGR